MAKNVADMTIAEIDEERQSLVAQQEAIAKRDADPNHTWSQADTDEDSRINSRFNDLTKRKQQLDSDKTLAEQRLREKQDRQEARERSRKDLDSRFGGQPGRDDFEGGRDSDEKRDEDFAYALQGLLRQKAFGEMTERQSQACRSLGIRAGVEALGVPLYRQEHLSGIAPCWTRDGAVDVNRLIPRGIDRLKWNARNLSRDTMAEFRALSAVTGDAGGYTVPTGFVNEIERQLLMFGGPRLVASILRTDTGNDLPQPTLNDTNNKGARLSENTTIGSSVDPVFALITMKAWKYHSRPILIPNELLEDSPFTLLAIITELLGERLGRIQSDEFTTGDNDSKPQGIVTGATLGKTCASETEFTYDEIIDLMHSVEPSYRADPSVGFMCHDNVLSVLRKKKDGQDRPLFELGVEGNADKLRLQVGSSLFRFPVTINQSMDSAQTAGKYPMLFGQFKKFKIRDVNTMRVVVMKERYADVDCVAVDCFMRSDSKMINSAAIKKMRLKPA